MQNFGVKKVHYGLCEKSDPPKVASSQKVSRLSIFTAVTNPFIKWIVQYSYSASIQSSNIDKAVEQGGGICTLDQIKWNSRKGLESSEL